jgi:hypothetical protein
MISEERVEAAVAFIRDNAERLGELIGHCKGVEYQAKVIKAQNYLDATGGHCKGVEYQAKVIKAQNYLDATGTIQARESEALASPEYKSIVEEIENAWAEKSTLETKLKAAELTITVWSCQNASRRKGHVL